MKVMFNVTGTERKALVNAISHVLGQPMVYRGAPTFAYEVGYYIIDKNGTLIIPPEFDISELDYFFEQLALNGYAGQEFEQDDPGAEDAFESSGAQEAINHLRVELESDTDVPTAFESSGAQGPIAHPEPAAEDPDGLTIELPLDGLTDAQLLNLEKLVAGKAGLIRKALVASELTIARDGDKLRFPWFSSVPDSECVGIYTQFIAALCATARRQKRVLGAERPVDSEKFAFRIFLLKLGFAGPDHKHFRELLLRNLSGPIAFPNVAKAKAHADRWKDIRRETQVNAGDAHDQEAEHDTV